MRQPMGDLVIFWILAITISILLWGLALVTVIKVASWWGLWC